MADSWQEIDGDGVIMDWDNPDMGHAWHYLEAIRRAIVERYQALKINVPTLLDSNSKLCNMNALIYTIDLAVTQLIAAHVNHTDQSGNWTGETVIPNWTEELILIDIGDAERYSIAKINTISPQWFKQQYDILNRLKWHSIPYTNNDSFYADRKFAQALGGGQTWNDCESIFAATAWTEVNLGVPGAGYHYRGFASVPEPNFYKQAHRYKISYSFTHSFVFDVDFYVMPLVPPSAYPDWQLQPISSVTSQDVFNLSRNSGDISTSPAWLYAYELTDFAAGFSAPSYPLPAYAQAFTSALSNIFSAVFKFDGASGFLFRGDDW